MDRSSLLVSSRTVTQEAGVSSLTCCEKMHHTESEDSCAAGAGNKGITDKQKKTSCPLNCDEAAEQADKEEAVEQEERNIFQGL